MKNSDETPTPAERHSPTSRPGRPTKKPEQHRAAHDDAHLSDRADQPAAKLLTVTIDADSARVIRVEGIDATGARHELSSDEKTSLVRHGGDGKLDDLFEEAFEAGIACVLGDDDITSAQESAEDIELRHELLAPLIKRSAVRRLKERTVLNRAIVNTLIDQSTTM